MTNKQIKPAIQKPPRERKYKKRMFFALQRCYKWPNLKPPINARISEFITAFHPTGVESRKSPAGVIIPGRAPDPGLLPDFKTRGRYSIKSDIYNCLLAHIKYAVQEYWKWLANTAYEGKFLLVLANFEELAESRGIGYTVKEKEGTGFYLVKVLPPRSKKRDRKNVATDSTGSEISNNSNSS